MKNLITLAIIFILPCQLLADRILETCNTRSGETKICHERPGGKKYIETEINQFEIKVPFQTLENLVEDFRRSSDANKYEPAGFCFFPLIESQAHTGNPNLNDFSTTGLIATLAIWEKSQSLGNVPEPREIGIYSFTANGVPQSIEEAGKLTLDVNRLGSSYKYVTLRPSTGARQLLNPSDTIYEATREFDLVFLDYNSFRDLATSNYFYPNGVRPSDPSTGNVQEGIIIERFLSVMDSDQDQDMDYYRSLIFKPLPLPELGNTTTEAAVAFKIGDFCPPYWRRPKSLAYSGEAFLMQASYLNEMGEKVEIWDLGWFRIILIILAVWGLIKILFGFELPFLPLFKTSSQDG